jgi:predicted nucleotide-binding protein
MFERLLGPDAKRHQLAELLKSKLVIGDHALAEELVAKVEFQSVKPGDVIIQQNADDNCLYFVIAGVFDVVINGRIRAKRGPGDSVGEMAAIQPTQKRSANVVATEDGIVARLSEADLDDIAGRYPQVYRRIAQELAKRLLERNRFVTKYRDRIKVFIVSSVESLPIAHAIQNALEHDPFIVTVWTDGVFRATQYTLSSIEEAIDDSDFAIAIAHADDMTSSRGKEWPSPRDNVIFELGLFMGRLGMARAIMMEPREEKVKLPSDMAGVTTIPYTWEPGKDSAARMAPACNKLRDYIKSLGAFNGQ